MPTRPLFRNVETPEDPHARRCDQPGCELGGEFRAPKSRQNLREYHWFCMEHVREYNKKWNYFADMSGPEIERYKTEDVTGHRPTWKMGTGTGSYTTDRLRDRIYDFLGHERPEPKIIAPVDKKTRDALSIFNLDWPVTEEEVKKRYKQLALQHHPDINRDDPKKAEEAFKRISEAYAQLKVAVAAF